MTGISLQDFSPPHLAAVIGLYNQVQVEAYGATALRVDAFVTRVLQSRWFDAELFRLAFMDGELVGMIHGAILDDPCYEAGGVVEMIAVAPDHRRRGIGRLLLNDLLTCFDRRRVSLIDGGGTFPFSPFYSTLLDGSERSGPLVGSGTHGLFLTCGFSETRESLIMRCRTDENSTSLPFSSQAANGSNSRLCVSRRVPDATWLDYVFRGWELWDSQLVSDDANGALSRAIFGFMPAQSAREGRRLYAIFGVNTPAHRRGHGYAKTHFGHLVPYLKRLGAEELELHVYADNTPAIRLYHASGFTEVARTVTLRKNL